MHTELCFADQHGAGIITGYNHLGGVIRIIFNGDGKFGRREVFNRYGVSVAHMGIPGERNGSEAAGSEYHESIDSLLHTKILERVTSDRDIVRSHGRREILDDAT